MRNYEDIEKLLVSRGYIREGEYDRHYYLTRENVRLHIVEHEFSFGMRYSVRARIVDHPNAEYGPQIYLQHMHLDRLYDHIEEIETGMLVTLAQL